MLPMSPSSVMAVAVRRLVLPGNAPKNDRSCPPDSFSAPAGPSLALEPAVRNDELLRPSQTFVITTSSPDVGVLMISISESPLAKCAVLLANR